MVTRTLPDTITVVTPVHPPRFKAFLPRALASVAVQRRPVDAISIAVDVNREGAGPTRDRALRAAQTDWVAFLDSDDEWDPDHIGWLLREAANSGADVVYSGCRVINPLLGGRIPAKEEWGRFGRPFDPDLLRQRSYLPVTSLVRTKLAQASSFVPPDGSHYDDWGFYLGLLDLGAKFVHLPRVTWTWHHGPHTTSGQPDRW